MHRFPTPTPPRLVVEFRAGSVLIETADVDETTVDLRDRNGDDSSEAVAATVIEQRGRDIVVRVPDRLRVLSRTPQLDLPRRCTTFDSARCAVRLRHDHGPRHVRHHRGQHGVR